MKDLDQIVDTGHSKSVHERLNEIKLEEITKTRSKQIDTSTRKVSSLKLAKSKVYFFFIHPTGYLGFFYRLFTFSIIFLSIIFGGMCTIQTYNKLSFEILFYFESFANVYFTLELLLRFWSSSQNPRFLGFIGKIKFLSQPTNLIELLIITINIVLLYFLYSLNLKDYSHIHSAIRVFQILRYLYADRDAQTWTMLFKVVVKHKSELLTTFYIAVFILLLSAYFLLLFEKPYSEANDDTQFLTYSDALYWAIITMTTIGFGDKAPRTFYGKIVSTSLCIIGMAFWTLPGGIIGSGFALQVEKRNKKKQFNRLVPSAAVLIQSWWRMKSTLLLTPSRTSSLIATIKNYDVTKSLNNNNNKNKSKNSFRMTYNFNSLNGVNDLDLNNKDDPNELLLEKKLERRSSILMQLSSEHLIAIRMILLMKYFSAMNKFKSAYKPYDFREDLIEQYTRGNLDIMLKLKELQKKIEQLDRTTPPPILTTSKSLATSNSVLIKLTNIENQINDLSIKLNLIINESNKKIN